MRVVIDTNVFVSALNFGGPPDEVLSLVWAGDVQLIISPFLLDEITGVLQETFGWSRTHTTQVLQKIKRFAVVVVPSTTLSVIKERSADNRVLECAVDGKARYIISGDKRHLLCLKEYQGIAIISPADFLRLYGAGQIG